MMPKFLLVGCLSLLLIAAPLRAQEEDYRLRTPTAAEYLQVINDHLEENQSALVGETSRNEVVSALSISMLHQFSNDESATFARLHEVYQRLNIGYLDGVYRGEWNVLLVRRWLDENQPDLSAADELKLAPEFLVGVTARDFNADGRDEYVLDVQNVDTMHMYLVAVSDGTGYRVIDPGLPWTGYTPWGRYSEGDGQIEEYDYLDLNADGLPEWVVLFYGDTSGGPGMGYVDSGALFVLGWRNDTLQFLSLSWLNRDLDLGPELTFVEDAVRLYPTSVNWSFANFDDDPALEILQSQPTTNNWGCRRVETKHFDWDTDADLYMYHDTEVTYDNDRQNCVQQTAEEAMWNGDYAAAIDLFEQALTLPTIPAEEDYQRQRAQTRNQYLRARLAMAYLLTGQPEPASALLDELAEETIEDDAVAAYVDVLHDQQTGDLVALCSAAFNVFAQDFPNIVIGGTSDRPYYDGPNYDPAQVGCDAPAMILALLGNAQIPVSQSPLDWLRDQGVGVARTFTADLDQDGTDEVLVWTDVPSVQVLFVPDSETYTISQPELDPYQYADELVTWPLPDDTGLGIATLDVDYIGAYMQQPPWPTIYSVIDGMGGGPVPQCITGEDSKNANTVRLWRLTGSDLTQILGINACANTVATALGTGGQRSITTTYQDYRYVPDQGDILKEVTHTYVWDDTEGRYIWQPPATPTPQATIAPTATQSPEAMPQRIYYSASWAFADQAYTAVLDLTPTTLDLAAEDRDTLLADMYLRALSLEALGEDESALTMFVSLQAAAPEHLIGRLAALHIEP